MCTQRKQESDNYSVNQIESLCTERLPKWRYAEGKLHRYYACHGWRASSLLFNAIAHIAEAAWHHPEITVTWSGVNVSLMTHSTQGITDKDFALAEQIELFANWQPAPNSPLERTPHDACWRYRKPE